MSPIGNRWIIAGALAGAAGVAFGAFGAHGRSENLAKLGYEGADVTRRLDIFETAARYQMYHALALVLLGLLLDRRPSRAWQIAGAAFVAGILLFSGLLYVLTFAGSNWSWLGAIVPLGGVAFIIGWLALAVGAFRKQ
jgi:uncharacterized membrane protein YgdD (TMEM256/DUF423 family)